MLSLFLWRTPATNGYLSHQPKDIAPCGEVCSYGGTVHPNTDQICPWPQIHKHFNCENIMKRMAYRNIPIIYPPPKYPPDYLLDEFTMFGEMLLLKSATSNQNRLIVRNISH